MTNPSPNPEKVLIIHSGGIGDLLLALPAMRNLRETFPRSVLHLMGYPERLALVACDLKAEAVHSVDRAGMAYFYLDDAPLPPNLGVFFPLFGLILVFAQKGGQAFSRNLEKTGAGRVLTLPSFPPEGIKIHVSDYLLVWLRKNGIEGKVPDRPLQLPQEALNFSGEYWARCGVKGDEKLLAIHPGSGSPAKNWSARHFAAVADWADGRARVLLISGPARDGVEEVKGFLKKSTPMIAGNLSLIQLAAVLRRVKAYLGNDSGITHLASALGLATVALFGPTDPAVWGPRGSSVRILCGKGSVSSSFSESGGRPFVPGPIQVEPEEVIEALIPLLG
jgi:ADP-heptose:LPS heptosyltransferase